MRLVDLLAGLTRLADLGFGLEPGEAVRSCALATELARCLDLPDDAVRSAYWTALLQHVGCTGYAHETALLLGDELDANRAAARTAQDPRDLLTTFLPLLTHGLAPAERLRRGAAALVRGNTWGRQFTVAACEVGRDVARRLALTEAVQHCLYHVYETWDGRGHPAGLAGEAIPLGARLARLTGVAVLFDTLGGPDLAAREVRRRAGTMLDPALATAFAARATNLLPALRSVDGAWLLAAEPDPVVRVTGLADVATVFGDLADLKSPLFHGHSRAVGALARGAGEHLDLPGIEDLEVAGLLHDVGRVAVSTAVWERSAWGAAEQEIARLHPYHSERILAGSRHLDRLAPLVGRHHERLDGSGYHRGSTAADLTMPARVLAAADAYRSLLEARPHREALQPEAAADRLRHAARAGQLDPAAVTAVLTAAGAPGPRRASATAGLTAREVEVLRLVARGLSNAEVARTLVISRRTAEHHVQHIYAKIGVSSRAAAAMFAMEHHLLGPAEAEDREVRGPGERREDG